MDKELASTGTSSLFSQTVGSSFVSHAHYNDHFYLKVSNFKSVAGHQFNFATFTTPGQPEPISESVSSGVTECVPPKRVNDVPIDLLTANYTGHLKCLDIISQAFGAD
jgi:hypothetical protein